MKKILILTLLLSSTYIFSQKIDTGKKHKVIFQMVSPDSLSHTSLMNNLRNLKEGWPLAQVEVVFYGGGIAMALAAKSKFSKELQDLAENKGVKMVVCENTMRMRKVTKDQLLPFIGTVPMGVGEIILKQEKGWSYLKAGL
ncbi:MAG: DsrE family protein [Bacteroidota bacterium]